MNLLFILCLHCVSHDESIHASAEIECLGKQWIYLIHKLIENSIQKWFLQIQNDLIQSDSEWVSIQFI